jgi:hypothetical protein
MVKGYLKRDVEDVRLVLDGHLANAEHVRQEVDIGHDLEPVL